MSDTHCRQPLCCGTFYCNCYCTGCQTTRPPSPEVTRIIREQAQRDADYEDVGLAAIHVLYTGGT